MAVKAEIIGAAIVVIGDFNPAIVTADWLENSRLLGPDDAAAARNDKSYVVSRELTQLECSWVNVQVGMDKLSLTSRTGVTPSLKDLAVGVLTLLSHTPVRALGMNFSAHYPIAKEDDYHKIGDRLAPKTAWDTLFDGHHSGLENLTIRIQAGKRGEQTSGDAHRFIVQPSNKIKQGVFFSLNEHREVPPKGRLDATAAEWAAKSISSDWDRLWIDAMKYFDQVLNFVLAAK